MTSAVGLRQPAGFMPEALWTSLWEGGNAQASGAFRPSLSRAHSGAPPWTSASSPCCFPLGIGVDHLRHIRSSNSESGTRAMKRAFVTVGTTSFDELVARVVANDCVQVSRAGRRAAGGQRLWLFVLAAS